MDTTNLTAAEAIAQIASVSDAAVLQAARQLEGAREKGARKTVLDAIDDRIAVLAALAQQPPPPAAPPAVPSDAAPAPSDAGAPPPVVPDGPPVPAAGDVRRYRVVPAKWCRFVGQQIAKHKKGELITLTADEAAQYGRDVELVE